VCELLFYFSIIVNSGN